jgi:tetratricopeptide (TPR) repeat protein
MTQELTKVRAGLNRISSDLKQGQFISAATSVREGARTFGRVAMLRSEQDELTSLLRTACNYLGYNKTIASLFPLTIEYAPGQEHALVNTMNQLIEVLEQANMEEAVARHKAYQTAQLEKGHSELQRGAVDDARHTLGQLSQDYRQEEDLLLRSGEEFVHANLFEDAVKYLELAAKLAPENTHILNRLGMARRKLGSYEDSERAYMMALELEKDNPNLLFNLGRLYLDWGRWEQAAHYARLALKCAPDFAEAGKMAAYAEKKYQESVSRTTK